MAGNNSAAEDDLPGFCTWLGHPFGGHPCLKPDVCVDMAVITLYISTDCCFDPTSCASSCCKRSCMPPRNEVSASFLQHHRFSNSLQAAALPAARSSARVWSPRPSSPTSAPSSPGCRCGVQSCSRNTLHCHIATANAHMMLWYKK